MPLIGSTYRRLGTKRAFSCTPAHAAGDWRGHGFIADRRIDGRCGAKANLLSCANRKQLICQIEQADSGQVNDKAGSRLTLAGPMFVGPRNERGAQSGGSSSGQIGGMCGNHHHLRRLTIEGCRRAKVNSGAGLVFPRELGTEDRIPHKSISPSQIDHQ